MSLGPHFVYMLQTLPPHFLEGGEDIDILSPQRFRQMQDNLGILGIMLRSWGAGSNLCLPPKPRTVVIARVLEYEWMGAKSNQDVIYCSDETTQDTIEDQLTIRQ